MSVADNNRRTNTMRTVRIKVYKFNELSKQAQQKAIQVYILGILENESYENLPFAMQNAVDKANEMQTPWFYLSYCLQYYSNEAAEIILENEYDFKQDGSFF